MHHLPVRVRTDRVGVRPRVVAPRAAEVVAFLENHDVETLTAELSGDAEAGEAGADDGDSDRVGHWYDDDVDRELCIGDW